MVNKIKDSMSVYVVALLPASFFLAVIRLFDLSYLETVPIIIVFLFSVFFLFKMCREIDSLVDMVRWVVALKRRVIIVDSRFNHRLAVFFSLSIMYLNKKNNEPIKIFINSNGGEDCALRSMISDIMMSSSETVGVVVGNAKSAAVLMLQACDRRLSLPYSVFLVHDPSTQFNYSIESDSSTREGLEKILENFKNYTEIKMKELENGKKAFDSLLSLKSKMNEEEFRKVENNFLSAEEALELGLIDEIVKKLPF